MKTTFFKNVLIVSSGATIAQIINIAASPFLTRLYSPEVFGNVGAVMAYVGVIAPVLSLKYDQALILESSKTLIKKIFTLSLYICLCLTILGSLISYIGFVSTNKFLLNFFWIVPLLLFFLGFYNIIYSNLIRFKKFYLMSSFQISRKLVATLSQLIFGYLKFAEIGLLIGNFLAVLFPSLFFYFKYKKKITFFKASELKEVSIKYKNYPTTITPQNLVNLVGQYMPIFFFSYFYNPIIVGGYYFILKLVQLPANLLGRSIRQVFMREVIDFSENKQLVKNKLMKITLFLFTIFLLGNSFIFVYGEDIFVFLFGKDWEVVSNLFVWMFLLYSSNFVIGPTRQLFLVYKEEKDVLIIDSYVFLFRFVILMITCVFFDAYTSIIAICVFPIFINAYIFFSRINKLNSY